MKPGVLLLSAGLVIAVSACGGGNSGGASKASKLVAKVEHASAKVEGASIVGTAKITEGGRPGEKLSLRYGLVDAVSGVRASQDERLAATYTTTASVARKDVSIRFPKPDIPTDYLLHVVLYGPDGSYLASSDSQVFTVR
jgi:hypothetical protein